MATAALVIKLYALPWRPCAAQHKCGDLNPYGTSASATTIFLPVGTWSKNALVSFEDVAVTFTMEEWGHLHVAQKPLYQEVMMETCGLLVSLGHRVPKSELIYLQEHWQGMWAVKRGLSQSTCAGEEAKSSDDSKPTASQPSFCFQEQLSQRFSENPRLGQTKDKEPWSEMPGGNAETTDSPKETCPGRLSRKQDAVESGDSLHLQVLQRAALQDPACEHDSQGPEKEPVVDVGRNPHQCQECGKVFRNNWALVWRQQIHAGVKPHECNECREVCCHMADFIQHMRAHTGQRLHQCVQCGKAFKRSSHLTEHQRTHTGDKP
ncbi:zinc finger protein 599-like [Acomys russatus]|uniref:zinc finger protein 599-like n=1 Tax=Acomys russatus TaxID=60746 RepID=UPI0021E2D2FD|nr:zinc finger protein 599-like [Acomys russatus]